MIALTPKQLELLKFINEYTEVHGVSPSVSEMEKATGAARSLVARRLDALEAKRRIMRSDAAHRSVRIVF